jgi:hypothetical protein
MWLPTLWTLASLAMELGGKTISIDVEVVDAPLDYNLLLGRSWFYAMIVVASSVFHLLQFPSPRENCDH